MRDAVAAHRMSGQSLDRMRAGTHDLVRGRSSNAVPLNSTAGPAIELLSNPEAIDARSRQPWRGPFAEVTARLRGAQSRVA